MRIKSKLVSGFFCIACFCLVVGATALIQSNALQAGINSLSDGTIPTLEYLKSVSQSMYVIKVAVRSIANERGITNEEYYSRQLMNIDKARTDYRKALQNYDRLPKTLIERELYEKVQVLLNGAIEFNNEVISLAKEARNAPAEERSAYFDRIFSLTSGEKRLAFDTFEKTLSELISYDQDFYGTEMPKKIISSAESAESVLLLVTAGAFIAALALGLFLGSSISRSLQSAVAILDKIAAGDFTDQFISGTRDEFQKLAISLSSVSSAIMKLLEEADSMTEAATSGKLNFRGNTTAFSGSYKTLMTGINAIVDSLVGFIDTMPAPAMIIDRDFNIIFMNKIASSLGKSNASFGSGSTLKCHDFFKTEDCKSSRCACFRAMDRGEPATSETIARPTETPYDISYTGVPVRDRSGKIVGALEIITDQTEIKKASRLMNKRASFQNSEIERLDRFLKNVASGDLRDTFKVSDGDHETADAKKSFDMIAEGLNRTLYSISEALSQVSATVEQVTVGSEQVAQASQSLSQGATEQASSLEEITASVTEISNQTKLNTENAIKVDVVSRSSKESAERGNLRMQELIRAMNDINANAEKIQNVIQVIDDIAFQINLLALNANVEAARAGKYGKGFAVVAEEVRNLAVRSGKSVRDTTEMIEATISSIRNGNSLVDATASQLKAILSGAEEVEQLAEQVCEASKEQSTGLGQISIGLGQIDQVTQSNTASAEESAAAAEELSSQAQMLKSLITRFRLKENGTEAYLLQKS